MAGPATGSVLAADHRALMSTICFTFSEIKNVTAAPVPDRVRAPVPGAVPHCRPDGVRPDPEPGAALAPAVRGLVPAVAVAAVAVAVAADAVALAADAVALAVAAVAVAVPAKPRRVAAAAPAWLRDAAAPPAHAIRAVHVAAAARAESSDCAAAAVHAVPVLAVAVAVAAAAVPVPPDCAATAVLASVRTDASVRVRAADVVQAGNTARSAPQDSAQQVAHVPAVAVLTVPENAGAQPDHAADSDNARGGSRADTRPADNDRRDNASGTPATARGGTRHGDPDDPSRGGIASSADPSNNASAAVP